MLKRMALVLMVASFAVPAQAWAKDASADIDQCANGPLAAVAPCQGSAWQNGNLNANQAHWFEGDSVPYRLKLADLVVGQQYVATIEWDTTKSGKHALDYLTSYDRTETTGAADPAHYHANQNNACSDYLSASDCAAPSTLAIPADPNIPSSITPAAGAFTVWGGTLDSTSGYTVSGDYSGDSSTSIDIAFTASDTAAVLAWGGHIALRQDWGVGNSAIAIPGSPYHMRLLNLNPPNRGGNQDRSLTAEAVIYPAYVTIAKVVDTSTEQTFAFAAAGAGFTFPGGDGDTTTFSLAAGGSLMSNRIVTFDDARTVSETEPDTHWSLASLECSVIPGIGGGGAAGQDGTNPLQADFALAEGDLATCTYANHFTPTTPGQVHPAIAIDKAGPASANAGDQLAYALTVTNPGDEAFDEANVKVTDPQCDAAPVQLVSKNGDLTPATLDPGDTWTYTCSLQTQVGDAAVHNVATVDATDQFGTKVSASDPADTVLVAPGQLVLGARITPGTAQLLGATGCQSRAFSVRVRGTKIARVVFVLDGKVVGRLRSPNSKGLFALRINPAKMRIGVHRLVATVVFSAGSGTKPKTLRLSFQRCARRFAPPRFTG